MSTLTVIPAYGRDYKSKKAVIDDWEANKDFKINDIMSRWDGASVNKKDLMSIKNAGEFVSTVNIRYAKRTKRIAVKIDRKEEQ